MSIKNIYKAVKEKYQLDYLDLKRTLQLRSLPLNLVPISVQLLY